MESVRSEPQWPAPPLENSVSEESPTGSIVKVQSAPLGIGRKGGDVAEIEGYCCGDHRGGRGVVVGVEVYYLSAVLDTDPTIRRRDSSW